MECKVHSKKGKSVLNDEKFGGKAIQLTISTRGGGQKSSGTVMKGY